MKQLILGAIFVFGCGFSAFGQNADSNCATIDVAGGGVVEAGELMIFTANIVGTTENPAIEYEWTVSSGTISKGQRTPAIFVETTGLADGTNITAKVKVKGLPENCADTNSETGSVITRSGNPIFDEFGKLSSKYDVMARIQNLYVILADFPTMQGYIVTSESDREITARQREIQSAIKKLKLDSSRVTMIRGGRDGRGKEGWTMIFIKPPGTDFSWVTTLE